MRIGTCKASDTRKSLLIKDAMGNVLHRVTIAKGKESYKCKFDLREWATALTTGVHQEVWEIHAASWTRSGSFTNLIGLKSG